jgi:hypothetical protein
LVMQSCIEAMALSFSQEKLQAPSSRGRLTPLGTSSALSCLTV